ncbi:MAG: PDZ domain-containing protein [Chromatocurvus sp.]
MHMIYRLTAVCTLMGAATALQAAHHEGMDNKAVARDWIETGCAGVEQLRTYVEKHMADDGVFMPGRYVGLGFSLDPNNDEQAVVAMVTPGTPAAEVLKEGDVFVSVDGMEANYENRDRMTFRGKPGEPVAAVIMREGKEMPVEVMRGIIATESSKAQALRGLSMADAESWPADSCEIREVVGEGNVVYVHDSMTETEEETGITYEMQGVTRFEFNDEGKVVKFWSLNENRFMLEQLGYTISR